VNRAILEAHCNGVLTSATLMANAPAVDDALASTRSTSSLGTGCHIVLVDGTPLLPPHEVPDLLEPGTQRFHRSLSAFIRLALRNKIAAGQIEAEAAAQIRKLQEAGVAVSHIDTHKHTHIFPQILRPLMHAARACEIHAIRNPFEPVRASLLWSNGRLYKRWFEVKALRVFARSFVDSVARQGMRTTSGTLGIVATGLLDGDLLAKSLADIPDGTWEFVCHPGYNDFDLQSTSTRLRESRARELQVLTAPATRVLLQDKGFQLISYRDL
jgi:predicted glycoside hydrolase/deacetylase ChbG (UPF0249 family)